MRPNAGVLRTEVFQKSENIGQGFDKIPRFLDSKLGTNLECPKCHNKTNFQIFFDVELMSANAIIDYPSKIWRIETPNIGVLKIKDIKCLSCGIKNTEMEFIKND